MIHNVTFTFFLLASVAAIAVAVILGRLRAWRDLAAGYRTDAVLMQGMNRRLNHVIEEDLKEMSRLRKVIGEGEQENDFLRHALADSQAEVRQLRRSTPVHIAAITARENNWRFN